MRNEDIVVFDVSMDHMIRMTQCQSLQDLFAQTDYVLYPKIILLDVLIQWSKVFHQDVDIIPQGIFAFDDIIFVVADNIGPALF